MLCAQCTVAISDLKLNQMLGLLRYMGHEQNNLFEKKLEELEEQCLEELISLPKEEQQKYMDNILSILKSPISQQRQYVVQFLPYIFGSAVDVDARITTVLLQNLRALTDWYCIEASLKVFEAIITTSNSKNLCLPCDIVKQVVPCVVAVLYHSPNTEQWEELQLNACNLLRETLPISIYSCIQRPEKHLAMTQLIRMVRTSESALVRTVVVECLNRITAKHFSRVYVFLPSVIQETELRVNTNHVPELIQIINCWSGILLQELQRHEDEENDLEAFLSAKSNQMVQYLISILTRFPVEQECKTAAISCLGNITKLCPEVSSLILPFVSDNISSSAPGNRTLGYTILNSIIHAKWDDLINKFITQQLPSFLVDELDESTRCSQFSLIHTITLHYSRELSGPHFNRLMHILLTALQDKEPIITSACLALVSLCKNIPIGNNKDDYKETAISPFVSEAIPHFLQAIKRTDTSLTNVWAALYGIVEHAKADSLKQIAALAPKLISSLRRCKMKEAALTCRECRNMVSLMLVTIINRARQEILPFADTLMINYTRLMQESWCTIDSLLSVGELAITQGINIEKYMTEFKPLLLSALRSKDHETCGAAIGCAQSLLLSCRDRFPFLEDIVQVTCSLIGSPTMNTENKVMLIDLLGDAAISLACKFEQFLHSSMGVLALVPHHVELFQMSLCHTYTSIVQSLKFKKSLMNDYIPRIVRFLEEISFNSEMCSCKVKTVLGLLGDLVSNYQEVALLFKIGNTFPSALIQRGLQSTISKETAEWTQLVLVGAGKKYEDSTTPTIG